MLSLTRKVGESIIISNNIEVVVTSVGREQVKIGIIAPREISVHRKEIYDLIQKENQQSSKLSKDRLNEIFNNKKNPV